MTQPQIITFKINIVDNRKEYFDIMLLDINIILYYSIYVIEYRNGINIVIEFLLAVTIEESLAAISRTTWDEQTRIHEIFN